MCCMPEPELSVHKSLRRRALYYVTLGPQKRQILTEIMDDVGNKPQSENHDADKNGLSILCKVFFGGAA